MTSAAVHELSLAMTLPVPTIERRVAGPTPLEAGLPLDPGAAEFAELLAYLVAAWP
ncbi:MAG: hypothetical protein ABWX71_00940 [Aeromicrobium sp.]